MWDILNEEDLKVHEHTEKQNEIQKSYVLIPIDIIEENTRNPNKMDETEFQKLKESIDKSWWNWKQPIEVRIHPNDWEDDCKYKYQIIDWAHRFRAMKACWFEEIIAIINDMDEKDAMIDTIKMNKHRWTITTQRHQVYTIKLE